MNRRSFISYLAPLLATVAAFGQKQAVLVNGKAKVCENDGPTLRCPLKHETCRNIAAPLVVGNGSYDSSAVAQLREKIVIQCDVCGVLFIEPR